MSIIIWKIIITGIIVTETIIGTFLGWRVLKLMERVKNVQADRNKMDEERRKQSNELRLKGIEIDELKKKMHSDIMFRVVKTGESVIGELLSDIEKKVILVALNRPDIRTEMEKLHTSHTMKKSYEDLKEKIKKSFDD